MAGVQEGSWPDLRRRGSLLGTELLVDVLAGRDAPGGPPMAAQLAEERRLFYVAVTRARDSLSIYTPQRMPTNGGYGARHVLTKPSRFLTDQARAVADAEQPVGQPARPTAGHAGGRVQIPTLQELFR